MDELTDERIIFKSIFILFNTLSFILGFSLAIQALAWMIHSMISAGMDHLILWVTFFSLLASLNFAKAKTGFTFISSLSVKWLTVHVVLYLIDTLVNPTVLFLLFYNSQSYPLYLFLPSLVLAATFMYMYLLYRMFAIFSRDQLLNYNW